MKVAPAIEDIADLSNYQNGQFFWYQGGLYIKTSSASTIGAQTLVLTEHQDISGKMNLAPITSYSDFSQLHQGQFYINNDEVILKHTSSGNTGVKTLAEKATTLAGYGITDAYTKAEVNVSLGSHVPKSMTIAGIDMQDDIAAAELIAALGCITQHQDISGKEDTSNKTTSISSSSTDTQYPSALAVKNYVDTVIGGIENGSY